LISGKNKKKLRAIFAGGIEGRQKVNKCRKGVTQVRTQAQKGGGTLQSSGRGEKLIKGKGGGDIKRFSIAPPP